MRVRCIGIILAVAVLFVFLGLVSPGRAAAAAFSCGASSLPTPVDCLIDAIKAANANNEANTIDLDGSTFTLTTANDIAVGPTGLPGVTGRITIRGNGSTIQRDPATPNRFRILLVFAEGELTLIDATVKNGRLPDFGLPLVLGGAGGGIMSFGTLNLTSVTVEDNRAGDGVGHRVLGGTGGGIEMSKPIGASAATLNVVDSTIIGNRAGDAGSSLLDGAHGGDGGSGR